jgi:hypothetical protein
MSKKTIAYVVAGLIVPLLWTPLESVLIPMFPIASSALVWRATQAFVGLVSAVILVLPIVLALRPDSLGDGFIFIAAFVVSSIALHLAFGGSVDTLLAMLRLSDLWLFLFVSLGLFWLVSSRKAVQHAA